VAPDWRNERRFMVLHRYFNRLLHLTLREARS
jgi:hypothetical protein